MHHQQQLGILTLQVAFEFLQSTLTSESAVAVSATGCDYNHFIIYARSSVRCGEIVIGGNQVNQWLQGKFMQTSGAKIAPLIPSKRSPNFSCDSMHLQISYFLPSVAPES